LNANEFLGYMTIELEVADLMTQLESENTLDLDDLRFDQDEDVADEEEEEVV
jgi:hypothetical protein